MGPEELDHFKESASEKSRPVRASDEGDQEAC